MADALRATDADTAEAIAGVDDTSATVTRAMELLGGTRAPTDGAGSVA